MENRRNEEVLPTGAGGRGGGAHPCEIEVSSVESRDKYNEGQKSVALVSRVWEVVTGLEEGAAWETQAREDPVHKLWSK